MKESFEKKIEHFEVDKGLMFFMKRMYNEYIKPTKAKSLFIQSVVFMFFLSIFSSLQLYLVKPFMESLNTLRNSNNTSDSLNILEKMNHASINYYIILALFASFLIFIFDFLKEYKMKYAQSFLCASIRKKIFAKFLNCDFKIVESLSNGRLMTSFIADLANLSFGLASFLIMFIKESLTVVGLFIVLIVNSKILIIFTLFSLATILPIFKIVNKKIKNQFSKIHSTTQDFNGHIITMVNNVKTIKSNNFQQEQTKKFSNIIDMFLSVEKKNSSYTSILSPFVQFSSIVIAVLIFIFFRSVNNGLFGEHIKISLSEVISFGLTMIALYKPLKNLGRLQGSIFSLGMSFKKVFAMIDFFESGIHDSIEKTNPSRAHIFNEFKELSFKDVSLEINNFKILKNVNFNIKNGENIGFVGETGSGKSTIANVILRFYRENSGIVEFNGEKVLENDSYFVREKISYIYQNELMFNDTILYNITYGVKRNFTQEELHHAIGIAECDFIFNFPNGLNTMYGKAGVNLSGGQIQRIFIARAILRNSDVFIFDEFTSALDIETEDKIISKLRTMLKNKTIINITHKIHLMKSCDRIYVIKNGEIMDSGSYDELIAKENDFLKNINNIYEKKWWRFYTISKFISK